MGNMMNIRLLRSAVSAMVVLMLLAVPTAFAQTPPKGDNVANPANVPLNTQRTVKNVQFATMEGIGIEAVSCDGDNSSDHSVWFRFTMPYGGTVDIDSSGSIVNGATGSHTFVALSLHQANAGLTEAGCQVSSTARLVNQTLPAGTYLVRIANDSVNEPSGPSQYRLSVRARFMSGFLEDSSFESTALGVHWKVKRAGDPPKITRVCSGGCVVRFGGVAGGKLQQKVAIAPSVLKFKVGDVASANAFINNTGVGGSDVKLTLKIVYSDGTPATVASVRRHITQTGTAAIASFGSVYAEVRSKNVQTFIFMITSPVANEMFSVDSATMQVQAGTSVRTDGLLPVPPAPSGW
jgi:hypothetical protein